MSGLIVLNNPEGAEIDVVFIHGLMGHRTKTWTKNDVLWPDELLPKKLPTARIMTFGYDADIVHFWSRPAENRVDVISNSFFSQLMNNRSATEAATRPIIFVAHSLGGVVLANALIDAASNSYGDVSASTRGITFLGTPHRGSSKAKWGEQARKFISYFKTTNPDILKDLEEKSEKLAKIGDAFPTLLNTRAKHANKRIEVVCFYEGQPMGSLGKIVEQESATLQGYGKIMLNANHSEMCKFASEDENYAQVSDQLVKWAKDLKQSTDTGNASGDRAFFYGPNYGLQQQKNEGTQYNLFGSAANKH